MSASFAPALDHALSAHEADPTGQTCAHLGAYSFRFAPEPPVPIVQRPADDEAWTLAQTLQELRLRHTDIVRTTRGLRVRHAWRIPQLAEAVQRHEPAVMLWLELGRPAPSHGWDDATALHRHWLRDRFAPAGPLALRNGITVTDWTRFSASVEGRYANGPDHVSAPQLRDDVATLFDRYATPAERLLPVRQLARAA
ncbi:MAG: hypothetical protein AAGK21_13680 [Bacteroidota bacterium]